MRPRAGALIVLACAGCFTGLDDEPSPAQSTGQSTGDDPRPAASEDEPGPDETSSSSSGPGSSGAADVPESEASAGSESSAAADVSSGSTSESTGAQAVGDQFPVIDVTYTATADNTVDSHYRVPVSGNTPADWTTPVDFSEATVWVELEIVTKPSDVPTLYNVCFEGAVGYTCMAYPPAYTEPGVMSFWGELPTMWNYESVDWSAGIEQVALILKDENQVKQQGNPLFYPYTATITITIVPPGEVYVPRR